MRIRSLVLMFVALIWSNSALSEATFTEADIREAWRKGFSEGWLSCEKQGCGQSKGAQGNAFLGSGLGTPSILGGNGLGGNTQGNEIAPEILNKLGIDSAINIPKDWAIVPLESGSAILGDFSGETFKPYILDNTKGLRLLTEKETPNWASDPNVLKGITGSSTLSDGPILLPVSPK